MSWKWILRGEGRHGLFVLVTLEADKLITGAPSLALLLIFYVVEEADGLVAVVHALRIETMFIQIGVSCLIFINAINQ